MFDKYEGMPEWDVLTMMFDVLRRESSLVRVGDDILACDNLEESEIRDGFKFAREEEHGNTETKEKTIKELMNEELDISKEMEILKKACNKEEVMGRAL